MPWVTCKSFEVPIIISIIGYGLNSLLYFFIKSAASPLHQLSCDLCLLMVQMRLHNTIHISFIGTHAQRISFRKFFMLKFITPVLY